MATTTNFGWETPDDTDLVKDGAAAMRTLGNSIDTSFVDLKGGTTGQVLAKASNTDLDYTWVAQDDSNAIQNAIVDAKGDLISATAADTPARLAVGTNGQVLTADSAESTGLKWATPTAAGDSWSLVTSTTTTGTASISLSVSGYDKYLVMWDLLPVTDGTQISFRINNNSNQVYRMRNMRHIRDASNNYSQLWPQAIANTYNTRVSYINGGCDNNGISGYYNFSNGGSYIVTGAKSTTGWKMLTGWNWNTTDGTVVYEEFNDGIFESTSAITSFDWATGSGNFNSVNIRIYGA
jgi:hypothetical protein